ncbi:hypothetical protein PMAYCL1PPCAC_30852, partial [Pristionchus mayeri]
AAEDLVGVASLFGSIDLLDVIRLGYRKILLTLMTSGQDILRDCDGSEVSVLHSRCLHLNAHIRHCLLLLCIIQPEKETDGRSRLTLHVETQTVLLRILGETRRLVANIPIDGAAGEEVREEEEEEEERSHE